MSDPVQKASRTLEILTALGTFVKKVIQRFGETPEAVSYIKDRTAELERFEKALDDEVRNDFPSRDDGSSEEEED